MKTNIATTQSQSARLLRCGVSADTADMCWHGAIVPRGGSLTSMPKPSEEWDLWADSYDSMPEEMQKAKLMEDYTEIVPAWSLSVLLTDILPCDISDNEIDYSLFLQRRRSADNTPTWELSYYNLEYDATLLFVEVADPIEAAVQMIEQLTNNGYKLNEI